MERLSSDAMASSAIRLPSGGGRALSGRVVNMVGKE
jgi:hypothetical protein